jgi:N-glycosidase YbiA
MTIHFKIGNHYFLSNFHEGHPFEMNDKTWKTAEHAYQAMKADNEEGQEWVRKAVTPAIAKKRGRQVIIRSDWDEIKLQIMKSVVYHKFILNTYLYSKLLDTGAEDLVEFTTWGDTYWGVDTNYNGENHLGKILMEVREKLYESIQIND